MNMDSGRNKEINKTEKNEQDGKNSPFKMPRYLSQYRVLEEEWARQERRRQRTLKVHEKGVKGIAKGRSIISCYMEEIEKEEQREAEERMFDDDARSYVSSDTYKKRQWGYYHKGTRQDFLEKQREMCQLKYCNAEREKIIQDLKDQTMMEEAELAKQEESVTDEAFLKFVKEETEKTALALKRLEESEKKALELEEEIKWKELESEKVMKNIAKNKEMLDLEKQCEEFLWKLSPPEWQQRQEVRRKIKAEKIKASALEKKPAEQHSLRKSPSQSYKNTEEDEEITKNLEFDEPQIYFTDPQQLINIMDEMEDKTQRLFEELDSTERSMEFCKEYDKNGLAKMKKVNADLNMEIEFLTKTLEEQVKWAEELQNNVEIFRSSESSFQRKDEDLKQLNEKIEQVFRVCVGFAPDTQGSRQMLKAIGLNLYELLEKFESLPEEQLIQIKRKYKQDKITSARKEEKLQKLRVLQEKREQRAAMRQQRTMAEVQKPTGKKEMSRSWLVKTVHTKEDKKTDLAREQEELEKDLLE
ncbi:cilia- and flagella-associated protein 100-like isoform X2 [Tachysurus fulvidraco]|uniref:cilia- and flagella-associated protein 100-like isoform X2 n=1 Tax=Tachysurus fulvidraco TaxID=1234273 RepID=UPI001FEFFBCB|nr:cilia- and flagella-associated protein 100-like isoform X2 [Tachysurus fulvidraco]